MFFGCEVVGPRTYELIDDFRITRHQPKTWKFYCKMGCGIYPEIDNVKKVMWNKNTIILQSEISSNKYEWYIMYSHNEGIKCCNNGTVISQVDSLTVMNFISENDIKDLKRISKLE